MNVHCTMSMSIVYAFNEKLSLIWPLLIRNLTPTFLSFVITLQVENEVFLHLRNQTASIILLVKKNVKRFTS